MKLIILEGSRGVGKSTVAFKLRQKSTDATLVNFTGFGLDNQEGLDKVTDYYVAWLSFIYTMKNHDSLFICDRFFFSEAVYSQLYKNYDFSARYKKFTDFRAKSSDDIHIFHLTINDKEELKGRLVRDKVPFGQAEESVEQTLLQQERYTELFAELKSDYASNYHTHIHEIQTDGKSNDEVYEEIIKKLQEGN